MPARRLKAFNWGYNPIKLESSLTLTCPRGYNHSHRDYKQH